MAQSLDNFEDLKELGIEDVGNSLTENFNKAAQHLPSLLSKIDTDTTLTLYGYYKQGNCGPCDIPKPWFYDTKAKAKWEAWNKLKNMPQDEAKKHYIELIEKIDPEFKANETPKEQWVKVSSLQNNVRISESNKNLIDYIKEGNEEKVENYLKTYNGDLENLLNKIDDDSGLGLIHWATDSGFVNILKVLLSSGANVNLQDVDGQTALHYASSCGHADCVRLLLSKGASIEIVDNDGLNASAVAIDDAVKELF